MSGWPDTRRIGNLLRRDFIGAYRIALVAAAAVGALMIVQALLTQPFTTDRTMVYLGAIWLLAFIAGPIVASRAFAELHDKERNVAYLLLPASAAEKVIVRVVFVTAFYLVASIVTVTVFAWIILAIKALAFGTVETPFVPVEVLNLHHLALYLAHQSLFVLGAAWFRRHHFLKTGLAIAVLIIGLIWFAMLVARFTWPDLGELFFAGGFDPVPMIVRVADAFASVSWVGRLLGYVLLPAFCWFVAWLRVREAQVSHGV